MHNLNLTFLCCAFSKCLLLFLHQVTLATNLRAVMVPNHLISFWQSCCPAWLNCTYVRTHTPQFDKVLGEGGLQDIGGLGITVFSGKYPPTHSKKREIPDLKNRSTYSQGGAFPALICFCSILLLDLCCDVFSNFHWLRSCLYLLANWCLLPNTAA